MVGEYDSNNLKNQFTFKVTFNNIRNRERKVSCMATVEDCLLLQFL